MPDKSSRSQGRSSLATALGIPLSTVRLYRRLRAADGLPLEEAAASLLRTPAELQADLTSLVDAGVVELTDDVLRVRTPAEAVSVQMEREARAVSEAAQRLETLAGAAPLLAELVPEPSEEGERLDAEVVHGGVLDLVLPAIGETAGELLFLRPDQWRLETARRINAAVDKAVAQGRRVRAIYPALAWHQHRDLLVGRMDAGEELRLLPVVPTRLAVFGHTRALLPDPPGSGSERRVLLRHEGVVQLLTDYFDQLWDRAVVPVTAAAGDDVRRLVLDALAGGARDEQVARMLGLSLRTVRRRIAELMIDLGADSRFQAGVEAVRRGLV